MTQMCYFFWKFNRNKKENGCTRFLNLAQVGSSKPCTSKAAQVRTGKAPAKFHASDTDKSILSKSTDLLASHVSIVWQEEHSKKDSIFYSSPLILAQPIKTM